jgi:hypothetical protein
MPRTRLPRHNRPAMLTTMVGAVITGTVRSLVTWLLELLNG